MYSQLLLPDLLQLLQDEDDEGLREFCEVLHPAATAEVLEELEPQQVWDVLSHCPLPRQVEIFQFFSLPNQIELVENVDRDRFAGLLEEMAPDDRVDLLSRLDSERVERLLPLIARAERADIRKLLSFPEDSAGAIMTTEYASLPEDVTVREALDRLRKQAPERETIYYVFILGEHRRLDGVISLRELVMARPDAQLADVMNRDVISCRLEDDQEQVAHELARFDLIAIPVVDHQNQLVGIVTYDDVIDILEEEAAEDAYRLGAVEPMEDAYLDTPLRIAAWKRGVWLLFLALVALLTAQVLQFYEGRSGAPDEHPTAWMIMFLPLVLASGGNAGSQSATLVIRSLASGDGRRRHDLFLVRREFLVGILLGGALALVGFGAANLWFLLTSGESGVVGSTVFLVVVMGTVTGALLPITFDRLGMDPALMSTPLIAAIVDVVGVVIYYSVARAVLPGFSLAA